MKMTVAEIAKAVNADQTYLNSKYLDTTVTGTNFDSRQLEVGDLFIPLAGAHDGHTYVQSAIDHGAVATFWARDHVDSVPSEIAVLVVEDPLEAYQELSKHYLDKINPRVVAVTGSNGKTTTKDMIAAILGQNFNVTKTFDNFNNEIGVPYTVLQMEANTEFLVIELGMDRPGQLDFLSKLVSPDVAVITMIGEAHIEFFETRDKIADAKMEITHGLKSDGYFVYNGDEPLLKERATDVDAMKRTFGKNTDNDIYSLAIYPSRDKTEFKINVDPERTYAIPLLGEYNVNNALAAIEVGRLFQIPDQVINSALKDFEVTKNRTEWLTGNQGEAILSDVYNSNPTASKEVLRAFLATPTEGRKLVVLGDMLELGKQSKSMHAGLATELPAAQIDQLYLIGEDIEALAKKVQPAFGQRVHYYHRDQLTELTNDLKNNLLATDAIMLKASHGIHLEQVVAALTAE
ncbi:UDP-N-acetylmuramoyl-tripeptide--D-alanyl-D-alanine ligase [Lentilactobacillus kribbianus]|uniref:UDP-N-acetylmuramoyl-tripeptide--D-alanyl-D- alanine ligase n=1 Tax=Lentilactobacillus kribbianus TaxID=2729622 RepID=UPI001555F15A|nr:UDP-N-acetylmuramoyl-tripeptide--D-alanyl-D-alanine ligase [Lentilactobacillus kribbianus]